MKKGMKGIGWRGDDLEEDLAKSKQNEKVMVWTQLPLGSVMQGVPGIVDIITIPKSFTRKDVRIYEVKISRADFNHDVSTGKYRNYLPFCNQLFFAVPSGLVTKEEVPPECGLIIRGDKSWRVTKLAPYQNMEWNSTLLIKLLIKGYEDHLLKSRELDRKRAENNLSLKEFYYQYGNKLANRLANAESYIEEVNQAKEKIDEALGHRFSKIDLNSSISWLKDDIENLLRKRKYIHEAIALADITMKLFGDNHRGYTGNERISRELREIAEKLDPEEVKENEDIPIESP